MAIDQSLLIFHPESATPVLSGDGWNTTVPLLLSREDTEKKLIQYLPHKESWSKTLLILGDEFIEVQAGLADDTRSVVDISVRISLKKLRDKEHLLKIASTILSLTKELDLGVWGAVGGKYLHTPQEIYEEIAQSAAGKLYQDLLK